jgi:hypothetical protein
MTIETDLRRALRRAAVRASRAPSVRNTEPWRFVLSADALEILADPYRHLRVLDPLGRQLHVSCGCALFNARTSLAVSGYSAVVDRFPDPERPDLIARIRVEEGGHVDSVLAQMDPSAEEQIRDGHGHPVPVAVPHDLVDALVAGAASEGAQAARIDRVQDIATIARVSQLTGHAGRTDPASRAELQAWSIGATDVLAGREGETSLSDWLPGERLQTIGECVLVIGGSRDDRVAWLHTGEALERMMVELARRGFSASPMTQVLESGSTYLSLREELKLAMYPQALLIVRSAPAMPELRRRRLVDVLTETV